eukprot:symbB.v1.2.022286.t1/scaffold1972.1/size94142/9
MADFLQRLPLPRLVHFLDMILPQMVPVQSPCQSRRRRFASSYRIAERAACGEWDVEYTLNVTKLFTDTENLKQELRRPSELQEQIIAELMSLGAQRGKPRGTFPYAWIAKPTGRSGQVSQLARTYCSAALDKCSEIPYGEVHHLRGSDEDEKHSFVFQNIYHIGDTKSAQELEVFLRMSRERLRLCCGLQCTDRLHPNGPRQRQKLYTAALKLLWFAIGIDRVQCENAAQVALHAAIRPLLRLEDGHVLATLSAIVLALCEGRTGLAISGVFGAGKTRSAAVLLAGLLVFDPSLKLMVLTKENIAAHAVAEHLVSSGKSHSSLDAEEGFNKNAVSNLAQWLTGWVARKSFLEDEGQQYGNMEEAATVARTPATCLEVWSGDHRQTPGGLKKSQEAKAFRKKLTKRPLALRCQTQYIQAHDFEKIVLRYLDCPKESFALKLRQLLIDGSSAIDPAVGQFWHEHFGDSPPCLSTEIQRAAYVILWMGLRGEREGLPSMLATSFAEAAGVSGRQKWGLVLSSSARVSQVTYQTVVGVRYPELATYNGTQWKFGKYVQQESPLPGGFLPIFWDVPRANIHAVEDIGAVVDWLLERCDFWAGQAYFYLHDGELSRSPPDETFIHMLQQNCCLTGPHFPLPAIVEALQDYLTRYYKVRRLHLIVVDLWRSWKYNTARAKITDQLWYISHCADTHQVRPFRPDGPEPPLRCRRFAYRYALDEHRVNHVARATDRTKVLADVIQLAAHEEDSAPKQAMLEGDASDSDGSESASDSEQNDPPSSQVAAAEQHELMQIAYAAVGKDFTGKDDLIRTKYSKLQKLEMVPERWPLARLSFSLQPQPPAIAWECPQEPLSRPSKTGCI